MGKLAKGFGLKEYDEIGSTFVVKDEKASEDAIMLEIGDNITPEQAETRIEKTLLHKLRAPGKADFYKAYRALHRAFSVRRRVPLQEKSLFFELLATMIGAGISLTQSVKVYTEQTRHKYFRKVTSAIIYQLEKGQSFSQALSEYPHIFTEAEYGMIEAAEQTGRLVEALSRLRDEVKRSILIRGKIKSAMIYPAVVFLFAILAMYGMLKFVIPQMTALFTQTNIELPGITKFLIAASKVVEVHGTLVLMFGAAIISGLYFGSKTPPGRRIVDTIALRIPILDGFQMAIYQARFARSISNLIGSGISIVTAAEITARSMGNTVYRDKVNLIAKDVSQGITIAESIQDSRYFSHLLVSMIAVGEKTAQIDELANQIAEYYENNVAQTADNFAKIIQPFIILIVGSLVGAVVLSIMLPMTKLLGGIESL